MPIYQLRGSGEGSMLDGVVQGADAVRSVVVTIRSLYDRQEHKFAGPYGDNGFLEDYVAKVNGEPIGCVVLVTRNAAGQTQHVVASFKSLEEQLVMGASWLPSRLIPHRHRPRAELQPAHELQVDTLR